MELCPRGRVSCLHCFMSQPVTLVKENNKTCDFLLIFNGGGAGKERSVAVGFLAG